MDNFWGSITVSLLVVYPIWRVFARVGVNPALSLFVFIPFIGPIVAAYIVALSAWPKIESK